MVAPRQKLVIGTRGSKLALWQAHYIGSLIGEATGLPTEIKVIKTTGDKILDVPLAKVGGKGLFTKELEVELLAGTVDLCVHSMKDVPTVLPDGLVLAGMPERVDPRDAIVSPHFDDIMSLPEGARVGTSSLRRRAQIAAMRPDLNLIDVRGNLDTRMKKAEEGEVAAVILAAAGITRMGWADRIAGYIPPEQMISAVGQGAIGIEIREDDAFMLDVCARISDPDTMTCVAAERTVMRMLDGGCQVPIGAFARMTDAGDLIEIDAIVASLDGSEVLKVHATGVATEPEALGERVVAALKSQGADDVLARARAEAEATGPGVEVIS